MPTFEEIYRRYSRDVYRFSLALCGNPAEAEDLTSEAFVRAWAGPGKLRALTLKSYLLTIARNLYLKSRRHTAREAQLTDCHQDLRPGPETRAAERQELDQVLAQFQELPEMDRAILALRADSGLSYREIAATLGLSVSAAKVKAHRARLKLQASRARLSTTPSSSKEGNSS